MPADILDAVATWLGDEMSVPVYYGELPRSVEQTWKDEPQQALVVLDGSDAHSAGSNSYAKIARPRADLHCYGKTVKEAKDVYLEAAGLLKALRPRVITVGPVSNRHGVRIDNAMHSGGPVPLPDQEAKSWRRVWGSWAVHGSEVQIVASGGMFSPMFSEMFS